MRAIWTGAIGFGLVNIPVKIFSAIAESRPDFDLLDRKDHQRIRYQRVNDKTGKEVSWENIVKGYMLKDDYVILEEADFEDASPEKNKMITLRTFVRTEEIENIYYDTPYYLQPQKGGEKAYSLLFSALKKTKMAGLSTFVMRTAENLALIRPYENILILNKLRFREEIRPVEELKISTNSRISGEEMDMAVQLIRRHSSAFDISQYRDEYTRELMKIIRAKAKGKRPTIRRLKIGKTKSSDLLEQLKASLA